MRLTNLRLGVLTAIVAATLAVPASAAPILTGSATIAFTGDFGSGSFSETDSVTIGAGREIEFLDGTNIGDNVLLDFEFLDLGGLTITYQIQGGSNVDAVQPGYGDSGMLAGEFAFTGLAFTPGASIVGIDVSLTDVLADLSKCNFTASSVTIANIETFLIAQPPNGAAPTGLITIRLITREKEPPPAPEPAALALLGMGVLAGARRIARKR